MKTELYQKVYIKDQSDLPKEEGNYIVSRDGKPCFYPMNFLISNIKYWVDHFDWYFQPIEDPLPEISDEDILNLLDYLVKFIKRTR